jgi:hypothetical protein
LGLNDSGARFFANVVMSLLQPIVLCIRAPYRLIAARFAVIQLRIAQAMVQHEIGGRLVEMAGQ